MKSWTGWKGRRSARDVFAERQRFLFGFLDLAFHHVADGDDADKLAILSDSTDYGRGGRDSAVVALTKVGLKAVTAESFNNDDQDFSSQINKIKASGANGLVVWGFYVQGAFFVVPKKLEVYGATSQIFGDKDAGFGNSNEVLGGLNYYVTDSRNHRLNAQLIHVNRSPVSSAFGYYVGGQTGNTFAIGFSVFF